MGKRQRRKVIEGIVTCEKTCIDIGGWVWILLRRSKVCLAKTQTDQMTGEKNDKSSHCCSLDPRCKAGLLVAGMCAKAGLFCCLLLVQACLCLGLAGIKSTTGVARGPLQSHAGRVVNKDADTHLRNLGQQLLNDTY